MQTWDAITSRRNVRSFADRPIPVAELDQILEAGRRAPSSQNWQPWLPRRPPADPDPQARPEAVRRGRALRWLVSCQPAQAPTAQTPMAQARAK